ncbi:MAG: CoA pyrophosphatase [Steroidobacteraceae bacterium]
MIPDASAATAAGLPDDWSVRLPAFLAREPDHAPEHWRLGGTGVRGLVREEWLQHPLQAAAVLVPIVARPVGAALLLTVRADHLRRHAGQISFPGGRSDDSDADLLATALREAEEEIGLSRQCVQPIGYLGDHVVLTGFRITPVVALVEPGYELRLAEEEVAGVFELPLAQVLAADSFQRRTRLLRERTIEGFELSYQGHQIWGATAGMLRHLRDVLLQALA